MTENAESQTETAGTPQASPVASGAQNEPGPASSQQPVDANIPESPAGRDLSNETKTGAGSQQYAAVNLYAQGLIPAQAEVQIPQARRQEASRQYAPAQQEFAQQAYDQVGGFAAAQQQATPVASPANVGQYAFAPEQPQPTPQQTFASQQAFSAQQASEPWQAFAEQTYAYSPASQHPYAPQVHPFQQETATRAVPYSSAAQQPYVQQAYSIQQEAAAPITPYIAAAQQAHTLPPYAQQGAVLQVPQQATYPAAAPTPASASASRGESPDFDFNFVSSTARIALYDNLRSAPRVTEIPPNTTAEYIESLASKVYEQAKLAGGTIPYTVIREVSENFIHARFTEATVSIFDGGNTIRFADQGPGIHHKEKAQLPGFTSAIEPMKRYIRGVGSGLPIVREYLELSHGTISIEDNLGTGAVVTISLEDNPSGQAAKPLRAGGAAKRQAPLTPELSQREKDFLALFLDEGALGVTDLVKLTDLATSSTHATLKKLEEHGLVEKTTGQKRILTDLGFHTATNLK